MFPKIAFYVSPLFVSLSLCVLNTYVCADGYIQLSSFGVNRRVVTPPGHVKVKGRFTVVEFELPKQPNSNPSAPVVYTTPRINFPKVVGGDGRLKPVRVDSKPTFYLGCQGKDSDLPVEAGFQFEAVPPDNMLADDYIGAIPKPGWIIFMRWHPAKRDPNFPNGYWTQFKLDPKSWVNWRENKTKVDHTLEMELRQDGKLALTISGIGKNGSPVTMYSVPPVLANTPQASAGSTPEQAAVPVVPLVNGKINSSIYSMRRVVGITQGSATTTDKKHVGFHGYPDESRYTCFFSEGRVAAMGAPWQNWTYSASPSQNHVQQNKTGFDNEKKVEGTPSGITPRYVVEFPQLGPSHISRTDTAASRSLKEGTLSRYTQETVRFDLSKN